MEIVSHLTLYILLTVAVHGDLKTRKISNRLIVTGWGTALIFRIFGGKMVSVIWFLPDIILPVIMLYLLYLSGILGAGDIKLFSVVSGFTNLKIAAMSIIISFIVAAVAGIIRLVAEGELLSSITNGLVYCTNVLCGRFKKYESKNKPVCFSIAVFIGTIVAEIMNFVMLH